MAPLLSVAGLSRAIRIMVPMAALWMAWAAAYVYVQSHTAFPVPPMRLCQVPLYAMGVIQAPNAPQANTPPGTRPKQP